MNRPVALIAVFLVSVGFLSPASPHHVGVFTPKDDDITKNFKDIKFASQAGRFDVALRLFDEGVIHETMEKLETALPPGLEDDLRAALKTKNLPGVELRLALFLTFMSRERVRRALERLQVQNGLAAERQEQARKLLNAAWRYYNLADFVISRQDPKASVTLRTAFEDATTYLGSTLVEPIWAAASNPSPPPAAGTPAEPAGTSAVKLEPVGPDEGKARAALTLMERTFGEVIQEGAMVAQKGGGKEFLPRR